MRFLHTQKHRQKAFTLIEVVVALTILAWVLGSVLALVSQYADERGRMQERFYSNQVAWNQLMDNYQKSRGWLPLNQNRETIASGEELQGGQNWRWELEISQAMGRDLYRYQAHAGLDEEGAIGTAGAGSVLTMYLLNQQDGAF